MKIAVLGHGHWGRNLVRVFHQLGALGAVCEANEPVRQEVAAKYSGIRVESDPAVLFADPALDAVVIATPAETHSALAQAAMEAGKHVFVEKPLALRSSEAEKLVALAGARNRVLMVGHLLRYHPAILKLKELCRAGELGRIEYVYSNRLNLGKVRREENALWSFAPHDVSVLLHLFESMPLQASTTGGTYLQPNIADVTVSNLQFDNGARAHIFVSWLHPFKEQKLVVVGSKKMAVFDDVAPQNKLMLFDKEIALVNGNFQVKRPEGVPVAIEATEPLQNECRHFLDCVASGRAPDTDGAEGLRVLLVLQACQKSLQLNGEPVAVGGLNREILHA
jgi:UDP-2-acetamido-3-amino-2,3-dideoxy-glucuronate N-acetyltransferase